MKTKVFFLIIMVQVLLLPVNGYSQEVAKKQYVPVRIDEAPAINGVLDEAIWDQGNWRTGFTQFEPQNGQAATQETEFCIFYDDDFLYIGFRAFDQAPDSIVTRLTRRDNDDGDAVGIGLDSYYDQRTAFVFGVTAGGTLFDLIMTEDGRQEDPTWDPNWWARTALNQKGWTAEMKIPLSQLRFKKNGNGTWGLQVFRKIHRNGEMAFWQPTPADAPGLVHLFAEMKQMNNLKPRKILDVTPYMVTSAEAYQQETGNPFAPGSGTHLKAGLDAKIGITNNFTVDLTLNPDFGQVEADPSEVNLSAFESYFQEKRPFFIEGRNISSFSIGIGDGGIGNDNLFYSRRIGRRPQGSIDVNGDAYIDRPDFTNILGAAKVTGKTQDGLSLAIINALTGETSAQIDEWGERSFYTIEPLTNFLVSRVQKDMNEGNTIVGGMFTSVHRNLDENLADQMHREAYSGGVDFTQYFDSKNWMFNVNAAFSHVAGTEAAIVRTQRSSARYFQRPDADYVSLDSSRTSLSGTGGRIQIAKTGEGHWNMMAAMLWKSPEFEINDLGFMQEADQLFQVVWVGYRQWEPKGFYRAYNINMNQYTQWTYGGQRIFTGLNVNGFIRFKNYWSFNSGVEYTHDRVSNTLLRGGPSFRMPDRMNSWWGIGSDYRQNLVLSLGGNYGRDFMDAYRNLSIGPSLTYKPADKISFSFNPSYSKRFEELQYIDQVVSGHEDRYVFSSIDQYVINFSFRVNYTITPNLTIQYWGQPFMASGKFFDYKYITNPRDNQYANRFKVYEDRQIAQSQDNFLIDEDLDGLVDYEFSAPDFKVKEFLSNLVLRWEYNPGSTVYLVWSQSRSDVDDHNRIHYFDDLGSLFSQKAHNIFLLKFSYRFGLR
ncbi:MAG: DUF5916 domain-containing protein [Bacteroidales bacterium]